MLRSGKVSGVYDINAELIKGGGSAMMSGLHAVLTVEWQFGTIPSDSRWDLIIPVCKGKRNRQDYSKYRYVTLLSVSYKVLAHWLLM